MYKSSIHQFWLTWQQTDEKENRLKCVRWKVEWNVLQLLHTFCIEQKIMYSRVNWNWDILQWFMFCKNSVKLTLLLKSYIWYNLVWRKIFWLGLNIKIYHTELHYTLMKSFLISRKKRKILISNFLKTTQL